MCIFMCTILFLSLPKIKNMATILQQPSALEFSCMLPDIIFGSNADHSVVTVTIEASGDTKNIYQETLFPSGGKITLEEVPQLLEPYARQFLSMTMIAKIEEYNAAGAKTGERSTDESTVLFSMCDVGESASLFTAGHFLTTLNGPKIVYMGCEERLYAYDATQVSITGRYFDGSDISEVTVTLNAAATTNDISAFFVSPADVDALLGQAGDLLEYVVVAGERSQVFKVSRETVVPAPSLAFINSFGCTEFIHCVGTHQKESKYDRQSARFHSKLRNYRATEQRTFKANTGWLNTAMADWADELFRSLEVYLWVDNTIGKEVILSDSQSVINNDDDDMPAFEFSYSYSQRIHNVMQRGHAGRIFDNTFDHTFN